MGMWKSKYGKAQIILPSVAKEEQLEYEFIKLEVL